ncbi:MAG: hypothetical protein JGK30_07860 [Microcoleus sp. PH2017_40_RAT_O_B]|uniref:Calx-beta domain-containing protein n=1 Tax=unclassified Microcoleus TaxID=2642155 RepID=UPI001DDC01F4|nr:MULTISPECIES: Calx-beta domain-containing protein [unclassified Microcoleus]MCC3508302.1 hypothetical protein [Microcoleus sp. PH2017_17_BER_D_A]TAE66783.1 MAG: hypothetical protein EAZ86_19290 [Oscillatoriales cyanobacterium]MCC3572168.1 hypothetical protein [Microcoleus sp. PH2017_34_RAT_O_A]MCC3609417.1 hypothetical protein [Microcoleus sp. PH2017_40_RAT_O_B]TAG60302.1 MAG: hypothetical protein EAZ28_07940 [Oscillatoriales cyanobacterium]
MAFIISSKEFLVAEGSKVRGAVLRKGDTSLAEVVLISTSNKTAKAGVDYDRLEKEIKFLPGERQVDFDIQTHRNNQPDFQKEFTVQLIRIPQTHFGYAGQLENPSLAVVKILDMDT